jgi:hypothetical protein
MKVRNKLDIAVRYQFAGPCGGKTLGPGEWSPQLPANRYYDKDLQRSLNKGIIEVQFDEEDVGILGTVGIPGPVAQVLAKLNSEPEPASGPVISKPVVISKDPPPKQEKRRPARSEKLLNNSMRASALAQELKIPFRVLAAALEKKTGKRFYPLSPVLPEDAEAMRDKYADRTEIPEISDLPSVGRQEVRTLSDLSSSSDGIVSLADLANENRKGGKS